MIDKKNISTVIADDHPMILKGLNDELTANNYNVVGQAANGMQALELILIHNPIIALLDIDMPLLTRIEVQKIDKQTKADSNFIILSFHNENEYISQAKTLNLNGYLLKVASFSKIEECIRCVLNNEVYFRRSFIPSSLAI